ncbi:hypothetical protein JG687_00019567 [Phytophthora cactorum]|uniref:Uncharacterized protein n=1 Tax=Phytophthora cactorum TaxID=29920 RepID=A0A8T1TK75_9STRA|nr:hypothetical protein JG687_00019567 [Phytophthora cactorum]
MIGVGRCLHVLKVLKSGNSLDEITEIVSILYGTNSLVEDKKEKNLTSDGDQIEKNGIINVLLAPPLSATITVKLCRFMIILRLLSILIHQSCLWRLLWFC